MLWVWNYTELEKIRIRIKFISTKLCNNIKDANSKKIALEDKKALGPARVEL